MLFAIQPIVAKRLLPWFGGSAAVWITCLVFFQAGLLAGYLYAHALHRRLSARAQAWAHVAALVLSLPALRSLLVVAPTLGLDTQPTLGVLRLLGLTVGLPYVLLASTGPLLQSWLARQPAAAPPYWLFALSNLASLAALVAYPVLVEPSVPWHRQAAGWAIAYAAFAALSAAAAFRTTRQPAAETAADEGLPAPGWVERSFWVALAGCGTLLLLAVTAYITVQIVPAPLLWVVPLALYLLTFVLCFEWPRLYWRPLWLVLLPAALVGMSYTERQGLSELAAIWRVGIFVGGLFVCCMVCHGEIARRRPPARWLTTYYLLIGLGGALGGMLAGIAGPLLFRHLVELPVALGLTALLGVLAILHALWPRVPQPARLSAVAVLPFALGVYAMWVIQGEWMAARGYRFVRSFYGQLGVREDGSRGEENEARTLVHGGIIHGTQWEHASRRRDPTTYYCDTSGVGRAIELLPANRGRRVGVVGLGTGTLVAYGRAGDVYRVYEINPQVLQLARTEFSFVRDSAADVSVVLGDARLQLESEPPQRFDLLAIDAFSGDSVPAHLLTREALELYARHLGEGGIVALHLSNRFVDFEPVVAAGAHALGRPALNVLGDGDAARLCYDSQWILITPADGRTRYPTLFQLGAVLEPTPGFRPWTDELWSLYPVLRKGLR